MLKHLNLIEDRVGQYFRVGYYAPNDGLNTVWIADENGQYIGAISRSRLPKYFRVVRISKERDYCGVRSIAPLPEHQRLESARMRKMLGGGMRQAGVFAAAGIVALESMIDRLAEDHQNARALAQGLGLVAGLNVRPVKRRTNMVMFEVDGGAAAGAKFAAAMKERGVIAHARGPSSFRAVTHDGISRRDIDLVVAAAAEAAGEVFGD